MPRCLCYRVRLMSISSVTGNLSVNYLYLLRSISKTSVLGWSQSSVPFPFELWASSNGVIALIVFQVSARGRLSMDLDPSPVRSFRAINSFEKSRTILSSYRKANHSTFRYVAPERLNNEGFVEMINATKVRLIAIDEAHCISEWGHAFRPDYLKGNLPIILAFVRAH